jgi:hypothetical protein
MSPTLTELETQLAGADGHLIRQQAAQTLCKLRDRCSPGPEGSPPEAEANQQRIRREAMRSACEVALHILQTEGALAPVPATHS